VRKYRLAVFKEAYAYAYVVALVGRVAVLERHVPHADIIIRNVRAAVPLVPCAVAKQRFHLAEVIAKLYERPAYEAGAVKPIGLHLPARFAAAARNLPKLSPGGVNSRCAAFASPEIVHLANYAARGAGELKALLARCVRVFRFLFLPAHKCVGNLLIAQRAVILFVYIVRQPVYAHYGKADNEQRRRHYHYAHRRALHCPCGLLPLHFPPVKDRFILHSNSFS